VEENKETKALIKFAGEPDGPPVFIPEMGCEVDTFRVKHDKPCLMWHVPLKFRGDFMPEELANYDPQRDYRTDVHGRVLCYAKTASGKLCSKRAENRFPRCQFHGGALHPFDKIEKPETLSEDEKATGKTRYQMYLRGEITNEDLDDEELATASFRSETGKLYRPKNLPRDIVQGFMRAIYDRAQTEMRTNTVEAAKTVSEIMKNKRVDPEIRLKAANLLIERNLGRTPQVISITAQHPWEEIFDGITSGARESSRQRRAIEAERIIDVEVDDSDSSSPNDKGDNESGDIISENLEQTSNREPTDTTVLEGFAEEITDSSESSGESRKYSRNPGVLAQEIELKPFNYKLDP